MISDIRKEIENMALVAKNKLEKVYKQELDIKKASAKFHTNNNNIWLEVDFLNKNTGTIFKFSSIEGDTNLSTNCVIDSEEVIESLDKSDCKNMKFDRKIGFNVVRNFISLSIKDKYKDRYLGRIKNFVNRFLQEEFNDVAIKINHIKVDNMLIFSGVTKRLKLNYRFIINWLPKQKYVYKANVECTLILSKD